MSNCPAVTVYKDVGKTITAIETGTVVKVSQPGMRGAPGAPGIQGPITQTRLGLSVVAFDGTGAVTGVTHANGDTAAIGYNVGGELVQVDKRLDGVNYRTTITYSPTEIELNTVEIS